MASAVRFNQHLVGPSSGPVRFSRSGRCRPRGRGPGLSRISTIPHCSVPNSSGMMKRFQLAVCGLHLTGLPLNWQLTDLGATLVKSCKSASEYRLYAFTDATGKTKPGMIRVTDGSGASVDLEVWEMPIENFGQFMVQVPPPLGIGTVILEDGSSVKGFICEGWVAKGSPPDIVDITHLGGWRQFLASREQQ